MLGTTKIGNLQIATELYNFINEEALVGLNIDRGTFWSSMDELISDLAPINRSLLNKRHLIQKKLLSGTK